MRDMKKTVVIFGAVIIFSLGLSLVRWCFHFPGTRYICMFESAESGKVCMESRHLPKDSVRDDVHRYVDELLLGPLAPEFRPLFTRGTKALSCFVRDDVLYVNLSDELIWQDDGVSDIARGIELFRKNILHNFNNIHTIDVFVAGNQTHSVAK